jgi:hypothetical protein
VIDQYGTGDAFFGIFERFPDTADIQYALDFGDALAPWLIPWRATRSSLPLLKCKPY